MMTVLLTTVRRSSIRQIPGVLRYHQSMQG